MYSVEIIKQAAMDRVKRLVNRIMHGRHSVMKFPTFSKALEREALSRRDYVRFATMLLAAERLRDGQVEGAVAEVGVWRGETSDLLHTALPDRRLYLFDTFDGFPEQDLEPRRRDRRFSDTSIAALHARFAGVEGIDIVPGYVPDTLKATAEDRFSFVLLDVDLYAPTLASLQHFYPRLTAGAYCFIHDYNSPESSHACKRAVDLFMRDKPEGLVDVADMWGTVMFRKQGEAPLT